MKVEELLKQAYPVHVGGSIGEIRTQVLARTSRRQRGRRLRLAVAGGLLSIGAVAAVALMGPTAMAIYHLNKIQGSVEDVRTAVITNYQVKTDGTLLPAGRTIYDRGKWRIEQADTEVSYYENGTLWIHLPDEKRVVVRKQTDGPYSYNPSGFSVKAMLADLGRWKWGGSVASSVVDWNGHRVRKITIGEIDGRTTVLADIVTDYPIEYHFEAQTARGWAIKYISKPVFDQPVDPKLFARDFPPGTRVVDEAEAHANWIRRLEKPIISLDFGAVDLDVREVVTNSRGHVFILYTNGETETDRENLAKQMRGARGPRRIEFRNLPNLSVVSPGGLEYLSAFLQPYGSRSDDFRAAFTDGQILQGLWLIPIGKRAFTPGALKLTATLRDDHGQSSVRQTSIDLDKPTVHMLPVWTDFIPIAPHTKKEVLAQERRLDRPQWIDRGDWQAVADSLLIDIEEQEELRRRGEQITMGQVYFEMYQAMRRLGRKEEALDYLRRASEEPYTTNQYPGRDIGRALADEGTR